MRVWCSTPLALVRRLEWMEPIAVLLLFLMAQQHDCSGAHQRFAMEPYDQTAVLGSEVTLPCRVKNRRGTLQWTKDGFGLGTSRSLDSFDRYTMAGSDDEDDFSLKISPLLLEDDGIFQCQVGPTDGQEAIRSRNAKLTVLVVPEKPRIVQGALLEAVAGRQMHLECVSKGGKPPATITWFDGEGNAFPSQQISQMLSDGKRGDSKSLLYFSATRFHHNTTIKCEAENAALREPHKAEIRLEVKFAPVVRLELRNSRLLEFDSVRLKCLAEANPSEVFFKWFRDGDIIVGDNYQDELVLPVVTKESNGLNVTCEVTNIIGSGAASYKLNITYAPYFRSFSKNVAADVASEVNLKCDAVGNPPPVILWTKDDADKIIGQGSELMIKHLDAKSAGTYQCRVRSLDFPEIVSEILVLLRGPPVFLNPSVQYGYRNDVVHLECITYCVPSADSITWSRNGKSLDLGDTRYSVIEEPNVTGVKSILIIQSSTDEDFGFYNCTVKNSYAEVTNQMLLKMERTLPFYMILLGIIAGIVLTASVIIAAIFYQRRRNKESPTVTTKSIPVNMMSRMQNVLDPSVRSEVSSSSAVNLSSTQWHEVNGDPKKHLTREASGNAYNKFDKQVRMHLRGSDGVSVRQTYHNVNNGFVSSTCYMDYNSPLSASKNSVYSGNSGGVPQTQKTSSKVQNVPLLENHVSKETVPTLRQIKCPSFPCLGGQLGTHV